MSLDMNSIPTGDGSTAFPQSTDVVIVGGGIAGLSVAWFLAEKGIASVVCEKGLVAGEQSSRAFGWICSLGTDPLKLPLSSRSKALWEKIADSLGHDRIGYKQCGLLHVCDTADDLVREQEWIDAANAVVKTDAKVVNRSELDAILPGASAHYAGGSFQQSDARIEPKLAMAAFAAELTKKGVKILESCAVRSLKKLNNVVTGVVTEKGAIACKHVVIAGGAWSRLFTHNADVFLPQLKIHSSLQRVNNVNFNADVCVAAHGYAFRADPFGGYVLGPDHGHSALLTPDSFRLFKHFLPALLSQRSILKLRVGKDFINEVRTPRHWTSDDTSPFEYARLSDVKADSRLNKETLGNLQSKFNEFSSANLIDEWAGLIDATPDSVPVVSAVEELNGLYLCTGFSAYGLTMGPAAGELIAQMIVNDPRSIDPQPFRLSRFTDGTKLRVAP